jgi:hypothetical protein
MVVVWGVNFVFLYLETGVSEEYAASIFMIIVGRTRMGSFSIGRQLGKWPVRLPESGEEIEGDHLFSP